MNVLCLVRRHRWRVEDNGGEQPYEVCVRCGHYRNDVKWTDLTREANLRPGAGDLGGGGGAGAAGGDGGGGGGS